MFPTHLELAKTCKLSYEKQTDCINDVEYLVCNNGNSITIAFRGTEASGFFSKSGWIDLLRDLRIFPSYDHRIGLAHSGFLKGSRLVVDGPLKELIHSRIPLYITGHSLGGALAIIAGALLKADGYIVRDVVTFGCPRVLFFGSLGCMKHISVTQYRQGFDFVTTIPSALWGYRHIKTPAQLGWKGKKRTWKDHDMDLYIKRLNEVTG